MQGRNTDTEDDDESEIKMPKRKCKFGKTKKGTCRKRRKFKGTTSFGRRGEAFYEEGFGWVEPYA